MDTIQIIEKYILAKLDLLGNKITYQELKEIYKYLNLNLHMDYLTNETLWCDLSKTTYWFMPDSNKTTLVKAILKDYKLQKEKNEDSLIDFILAKIRSYGEKIYKDQLETIYKEFDCYLDIEILSKILGWGKINNQSWVTRDKYAIILAKGILKDIKQKQLAPEEPKTGEQMDKVIGKTQIVEKIMKVKLRKPASPDFIPSHFGSLSNLFPIKKLDSGKIVYEKLGEDPIEFTVDKMLEIFTKKIENTNPTLTNNYQQLAVEIGIYQGMETSVENTEL